MLELSYLAHAIVLELKFVQICKDAKNNTTTRNIVFWQSQPCSNSSELKESYIFKGIPILPVYLWCLWVHRSSTGHNKGDHNN